MKSSLTIVKAATLWVTLAVLPVVLGACQSIGPGGFGGAIPSERQIAIQPAGTHRGEADTGELVVAYAYQRLPEKSREIHIQGGIRRLKFKGDAVNVYLNFLDQAGGVIDRKILFTSGYRRNPYFRRPWTFDTTLALPPNTAALAFSSYVKPSAGRR